MVRLGNKWVHSRARSSGSARLTEFFEGIKYFESGTPEVPIVARVDGEPVPPGGRCDVTVFYGHTLADFVEQMLLLTAHTCATDTLNP